MAIVSQQTVDAEEFDPDTLSRCSTSIKPPRSRVYVNCRKTICQRSHCQIMTSDTNLILELACQVVHNPPDYCRHVWVCIPMHQLQKIINQSVRRLDKADVPSYRITLGIRSSVCL